ncbi:protein shisa-4 [Festucalex cinctus]
MTMAFHADTSAPVMASTTATVLAMLAVVLCSSPVEANEDCLWYVDKNGTWHNGFDCPLITFCCGNCQRRYCCLDAFKMITEREQKRCMLFQFSPTTLAGIASSILLFVAIIATMVCCFMCSCCYLYQRRLQRGRTPYDPQQIPMASYPVEPLYDAYGKPLGPAEYPHAGYPMAPQYPGMPSQYPMMQPGQYPPPHMDPAYSQAPPPYSPPQYPGH